MRDGRAGVARARAIAPPAGPARAGAGVRYVIGGTTVVSTSNYYYCRPVLRWPAGFHHLGCVGVHCDDVMIYERRIETWRAATAGY